MSGNFHLRRLNRAKQTRARWRVWLLCAAAWPAAIALTPAEAHAQTQTPLAPPLTGAPAESSQTPRGAKPTQPAPPATPSPPAQPQPAQGLDLRGRIEDARGATMMQPLPPPAAETYVAQLSGSGSSAGVAANFEATISQTAAPTLVGALAEPLAPAVDAVAGAVSRLTADAATLLQRASLAPAAPVAAQGLLETAHTPIATAAAPIPDGASVLPAPPSLPSFGVGPDVLAQSLAAFHTQVAAVLANLNVAPNPQPVVAAVAPRMGPVQAAAETALFAAQPAAATMPALEAALARFNAVVAAAVASIEPAASQTSTIAAPPPDVVEPILLSTTRPQQQSRTLPEADAPIAAEGWPLIPVDAPPVAQPIVLPDGTIAETLAVAIQDALARNPEIQIAAAQRDDAAYGVDEARAQLLPNVELNLQTGRERTRPEADADDLHTRTEASMTVRQNLWDFGAARSSVRSASATARSAEFSYRERVDGVAMEIASVFHTVLQREAIMRLAEENYAAHERILQTVVTQRDFGLVTGADVSRVEARLNAARADVLDQRSSLEQAREDFRRLLDRAPINLAAPGDIAALLPASVDDAVALLDENNPKVMQARMAYESLQRQRDSQRAGFLPRVDVELQGGMRENVGGTNGQTDDARAMVNMRVPLWDGGARSASIARINARLRQADFEVDRARRDAEQAIRNDYSALAAANEKVQAIESEVAAAQRLVELYATQFREGNRSVFDLLDGQQTLYTALVKRETNRTEMRLSGYRVLRSLGSLVEVIMQPPTTP